MRWIWLWLLLAVVSAACLVLAGWRLSLGPVDVDELLWMFVAVPAFVVAGVVLLLRRPGHPIGLLLVLTGIAFPVGPAILAIPTDVIFERSGAQGWMWASIWLDQTSSGAGAVLAAILLACIPRPAVRQ